jgi:hypothetical protein
MGEVWVAKQTEPVKRKVALKLIKKGMDSKAVLQRFEQERQALAMMDHPNIARVLDGGLTPTGQPFFVMEVVNGLPLTKFCDEARLTPKDRAKKRCQEPKSSKLPQEPHVVLIKQPDVVNLVTSHAEPFDPQAECEARHVLGVVANGAQDVGVDHTGPAHFNPALTAVPEHIHFHAGLGEREE